MRGRSHRAGGPGGTSERTCQMSEQREAATSTGPLIVVGVDGSDPGRAALAWAAEEALLRDASLQVLYAYPSPSLVGVNPPAEYFAAIESEARQLLEDQIEQVPVVAKVGHVTERVVAEPAGAALVEASAGADLLVVGRRGHGGFAELLLGSVSNQCVHHAHCPVVVVRDGTSQSHG